MISLVELNILIAIFCIDICVLFEISKICDRRSELLGDLWLFAFTMFIKNKIKLGELVVMPKLQNIKVKKIKRKQTRGRNNNNNNKSSFNCNLDNRTVVTK